MIPLAVCVQPRMKLCSISFEIASPLGAFGRDSSKLTAFPLSLISIVKLGLWKILVILPVVPHPMALGAFFSPPWSSIFGRLEIFSFFKMSLLFRKLYFKSAYPGGNFTMTLSSPFAAVRAIASLLDQTCVVLFRKIYRETNRAADFLAKFDDFPSDATVEVRPLPDLGWVALNNDGAVSPQTGLSLIGGINRDHSRNCLGVFHKSLGTSTILEAKLWGIYEGLRSAWQFGFERVIVQSDCEDAIQLLSPLSASSLFAAVRAIARLLDQAWVVLFRKIYR
ncbi:hypothetical protein F3Y22_tig00110429pilonHSYRG01064 [Hibiscus syriacus]|uniref:RNase H type-1 domain-containing protein n=1 Tax=Hibiscus syriacus TaxID=106335 RepID=A0A6A3AQA2_HIBSY|nr:hypothetical protein F3Y22_tig00110429pilonHSYRG01064 [Hibiscus syriacus]